MLILTHFKHLGFYDLHEYNTCAIRNSKHLIVKTVLKQQITILTAIIAQVKEKKRQCTCDLLYCTDYK